MRPCATAPLPFVTDGCSAGRAPVRVPMADTLPRHSGLAGAQPRTDVDMGRLGPGDRPSGVGWHPQHASAPSGGDSNSQ